MQTHIFYSNLNVCFIFGRFFSSLSFFLVLFRFDYVVCEYLSDISFEYKDSTSEHHCEQRKNEMDKADETRQSISNVTSTVTITTSTTAISSSSNLCVPKLTASTSSNAIIGLFRRSPSPSPTQKRKQYWPAAAESTATIAASSLAVANFDKTNERKLSLTSPSSTKSESGSATGNILHFFSFAFLFYSRSLNNCLNWLIVNCFVKNIKMKFN